MLVRLAAWSPSASAQSAAQGSSAAAPADAKELTHKKDLSFRNEFVDDIQGQRTGYNTKHSERLVSFGHWIGDITHHL